MFCQSRFFKRAMEFEESTDEDNAHVELGGDARGILCCCDECKSARANFKREHARARAALAAAAAARKLWWQRAARRNRPSTRRVYARIPLATVFDDSDTA